MPDSVQDLIRAAATKHGIPPELALAVAEHESGFNPTVIGPLIEQGAAKGQRAIGTFQFLPSTATTLGIDPNDPRQNIEGGARYLRQLMDKHAGDLNAVLAEYGGVKSNTDYVPGVLGRIQKFRQPNVGAGGGRAAGAGPVTQSGSPAGPGPTAAAMTTGTGSPSDVRSMAQQLAAPFDPRTGEGRTNLASGAASLAAGIATGGPGAALGPISARAMQVLAPIAAATAAATTEVAAENLLTGDPRNPLVEGALQGGFEAAGQLFPGVAAHRIGRTMQAPGLVRASLRQLRTEAAQVSAESKALVSSVQAKVDEALGAANAIKNVGVLRGPGAAAKLADMELDGASQLADIARQYDDLLKQSPSMLGAGRTAADTLRGPAKQALDNLGQQVAAAAAQGPPIPIEPVKDVINELAERWRPAELYGSAQGEGAALFGGPAPSIAARRPGATTGQRISIDEYKALLAQQLKTQDVQTLPGVLGRIQDVTGDTIPFEVAHTIKQILDSSVNWDRRAKPIMQRVTKAARTALREQMTGFEPYDTATAAYHALIPLYTKGVGQRMIRLANQPDGAVAIAEMLKKGDAAQALVLRNLLVDQATAGGNLKLGQSAWNQVRSAYTYQHLLDGGIGGLGKRLDDLLTARPEFVRAVYNDEPGQLVLQNIAQLADSYAKGRELLQQAGTAAVGAAKATGERAAARVAGTAERLTDSSLSKFTRRTQEGYEADALRAMMLPHSVWGLQSAIRLLSSPKAADVLEWAAYSNYNASRLVKLLTGPVPPEFAANVLREAAGVIAPPGQQGERITPTGTAAR